MNTMFDWLFGKKQPNRPKYITVEEYFRDNWEANLVNNIVRIGFYWDTPECFIQVNEIYKTWHGTIKLYTDHYLVFRVSPATTLVIEYPNERCLIKTFDDIMGRPPPPKPIPSEHPPSGINI
jgi:hypothetical protein